jgi:hypothetical protein
MKDNTRRCLVCISFCLLVLFCFWVGYVGTLYLESRGILTLVIIGMLLVFIKVACFSLTTRH